MYEAHLCLTQLQLSGETEEQHWCPGLSMHLTGQQQEIAQCPCYHTVCNVCVCVRERGEVSRVYFSIILLPGGAIGSVGN